MTRQESNERRDVLLVTRNLPPLLGGMERLNLHLAGALSATHRLTVIGPDGCRAFLPPDVEVVEVPSRPLPLFLWRSLLAAWRAASSAPHLAIAGSGLTVPMVNLVAWRSGAIPVAYVHGLDLVARHPLYRLAWLPALRRLRHAFANSSSTADIARRIGVAARRVSVLHPGVAEATSRVEAGARFRASHGLEGARVLLSVGRMTARKGLREFVQYALPEVCARHPEAMLVVVGDEAPDALNRSGRGGGAQLLDAASASRVGGRVRVLGVLDDQSLEAAYGAADVHVFPVKDVPGDIEGFGMVALEAAAHGLPTVAFAVGGVPDAVSDRHSGYLVAPGDYRALADRICNVLDADAVERERMRASARRFASGFRWERFGERLRATLSKLFAEPTASPSTREGHAVLDLGSRSVKARKIELLMGLDPGRGPLRMLEVGTGSGGIAHYFANHPSIEMEVDAVDVSDARQISGGYRFSLVEGTTLPFPDGTFDMVVTNHVIEHVGDEAAQLAHLAEVKRVLAPQGRAYLAVPNRWMLVEPHYRLAFLSWLPRRLRSPYLSWRRGVDHYDCEPLSLARAERLFSKAGLAWENLTIPALHLTLQLEGGNRPVVRRAAQWLPDRWMRRAAGLVPTLIFGLSRAAEGREAGS